MSKQQQLAIKTDFEDSTTQQTQAIKTIIADWTLRKNKNKKFESESKKLMNLENEEQCSWEI